MRRIAAMALAMAVGLASRAAAQPAPATAEALDRARMAISMGQIDEAATILGSVRQDLADRNDLDFLNGTVAIAKGDYSTAVDHFRAILVRDPSLLRVRLELARVLFLKGDDEVAEYHFRIAQAAGLPEEVQRKVDEFLDLIRRRRSWSLDVSLGIAPDTNINAATAANTVNLYGLPFQLDDNAKKTSGVGVTASMGGAYQVDLSRDARLVMGGRLTDVEYAGNQFDDRSVTAFIGPRFLMGDASELTVKALGARRWFGGSAYTWSGGGRIEAQSTLSPRLLFNAAIEGQQVVYDEFPAMTGPVVSASVGLTYGIDQASLARLDLAVIREQTEDTAFRDFQYFAGASYYRDLPWGFGLGLGASVDFARFDDALPAFGVTRHDLTANFRVALSNRAIDLFGFTPVVAYVHTQRFSNIDFYEFSRDRLEITLTRNF